MESSDFRHPVNAHADSVGFKLAVEPACHLVNLGHVHLDGRLVLGADDSVAGTAFSLHVQIHKLAGVILHADGASGGTMRTVRAETKIQILDLLRTPIQDFQVSLLECPADAPNSAYPHREYFSLSDPHHS